MFVDLSKVVHYAKVFYRWKVTKDVNVDYLPEDVSIEVTNVCNFRCNFCPQSSPEHFNNVPRSYLIPKAAEILIRRLREGGVKTRVIHWTLDGEPFMNKKFGEICAIACRYGFNTMQFATNGSLCTAERLNHLPREAKYILTIDYCADEEYFEAVRGTKGSWRKIRDNINMISLDRALDHIHIELTDISGFAIHDKTALRSRYNILKQMFSGTKRISFTSRTLHNATGFLPFSEERRNGKYHLCPYPWSVLHVASNGDVVACPRDLDHKTILGNLFRSTLPEIWNGPAMQELRRSLKEQNPQRSAACANCDMPYDGSKFTMRNFLKAAKGRLQILSSRRVEPIQRSDPYPACSSPPTLARLPKELRPA